METKTKHSVGGAVFLLIVAVGMAFFLPYWAANPGGESTAGRAKHRAMENLLNGILETIGPVGATIIGIGLVIAAIMYLVSSIQNRKKHPSTPRLTDRRAACGKQPPSVPVG